jgi:uncharacterized protein YjbI with pentapeptide repeats
MMLSTLAAMALAASSTQADDASDLEADARDYCDLAEAVVIDASGTATVSDLVARAEQAGSPLIITWASLDGADMRPLAPYLGGGCILDSTLKGSNWAGVTIPDLRVVRTDLESASFRGATLSRARFEGAGLAKADFESAGLRKARFVGAYSQLFLGEARFHHASMEGAVFDCGITVDAWCMDVYTAVFFGTRLEGADLTTLGVWDEDMLRYAVVGQSTAVHPRSIRYMQATEISGSPLILRASLPASGEEGQATPEAAITPEEFDELNAATLSYADDRPSFDCGKAKTQVEKLICGEYASALRTADRDMAALYGEAKKGGKITTASQKAWLTKRNKCTDEECLAAAYRTRMDQLFAALGPRWALAPDESMTYREDVLPLPSSLRSRELYARIRPVLSNASAQYVTLTGMEDGSISAEGFALGGNAHMCDFGVDSAQWDPKTGWYSATAEDGSLVPLFRIWGERLIIRYSGNMGDTPDEAQEFISCGARAGFSDLRDLGE